MTFSHQLQFDFGEGAGPFCVLSEHPLYVVWRGMKSRCFRKNNLDFARYGGRGISIDPRFMSSKFFVRWGLEHGWAEGLHLDRIDNDGDYSPENCRFVTPKVNVRNRRCTVRLGDGRPVSEVAEANGLSYNLVRRRIALGWTYEQACGLAKPPYRKSTLFVRDGLSLADAAKQAGLTKSALRMRLRSGWPLERAISVPSLRVLKGNL